MDSARPDLILPTWLPRGMTELASYRGATGKARWRRSSGRNYTFTRREVHPRERAAQLGYLR